MRACWPRDPPRRHRLIAVARANVLLNAPRRRHVGARLRERRRLNISRTQSWRLAAWRSGCGSAQPALHLVEPRLSLGPRQPLVAANSGEIGMSQQQRALAHMVEDQEGVNEEEDGVGCRQRM